MSIFSKTLNNVCQAVRNSYQTLRSRWKNTMPKFFRIMCWIGTLISGTAIAANTALLAAGATPHEWWTDIYPYLVAMPAGVAFAAKFTQKYSGKPIDYDEQRAAERKGRTILDRDIDELP